MQAVIETSRTKDHYTYAEVHSDSRNEQDKCTKIKILSYEDGKDKIVSMTKNISENVCLNVLKETDITAESLDERLNLFIRVPNPDLAIVFGKTMCTYGFLPWQSRITEFL